MTCPFKPSYHREPEMCALPPPPAPISAALFASPQLWIATGVVLLVYFASYQFTMRRFNPGPDRVMILRPFLVSLALSLVWLWSLFLTAAWSTTASEWAVRVADKLPAKCSLAEVVAVSHRIGVINTIWLLAGIACAIGSAVSVYRARRRYTHLRDQQRA